MPSSRRYQSAGRPWETQQKRTELKQILHNESELKKIHCAKQTYARLRAVQQRLTGVAFWSV